MSILTLELRADRALYYTGREGDEVLLDDFGLRHSWPANLQASLQPLLKRLKGHRFSQVRLVLDPSYAALGLTALSTSSARTAGQLLDIELEANYPQMDRRSYLVTRTVVKGERGWAGLWGGLRRERAQVLKAALAPLGPLRSVVDPSLSLLGRSGSLSVVYLHPDSSRILARSDDKAVFLCELGASIKDALQVPGRNLDEQEVLERLDEFPAVRAQVSRLLGEGLSKLAASALEHNTRPEQRIVLASSLSEEKSIAFFKHFQAVDAQRVAQWSYEIARDDEVVRSAVRPAPINLIAREVSPHALERNTYLGAALLPLLSAAVLGGLLLNTRLQTSQTERERDALRLQSQALEPYRAFALALKNQNAATQATLALERTLRGSSVRYKRYLTALVRALPGSGVRARVNPRLTLERITLRSGAGAAPAAFQGQTPFVVAEVQGKAKTREDLIALVRTFEGSSYGIQVGAVSFREGNAFRAEVGLPRLPEPILFAPSAQEPQQPTPSLPTPSLPTPNAIPQAPGRMPGSTPGPEHSEVKP